MSALFLGPGLANMNASAASRQWKLGRGLVLAAALIYGLLPAVIDLFTPQHLGDPDWVGHQRFHLVWQIFLIFYLGVRGFWLAWKARPDRYALIVRSAQQGGVVLAAFFTAGALAIPLGAAFGAPDEVVLGIPFPIVHFSIAAVVLLSGLLLCRRASRGVQQTSRRGST